MVTRKTKPGTRRVSVVLSLLLLSSVGSFGLGEALAITAGASRRDVTVPELMGDPLVHDPLFARVLLLDDGDESVAIICLDMIAPWFAEVREKIQEELGVSLVLVNCSHTHSNGRGVGSTPKWRVRVGKLIFEAAEEAVANQVPVSLHRSRAPVKIAHNRYGDAFTQEVVPWVNVLEVRKESGKPLAVLFEHPAHPVIAMTHPGVSADYPGYAVRRVNASLGEKVITMFAQGCSGNINADHVAGGHAHAEAVGNELGEAVLVALKSTTPIKAKAISLRTKTIMLNLHLPTVQRWEKMMERIVVGGEEPPREGWANDDTTRDTMLALRELMERDAVPQMPMEINAVMLGSEWCLVAMAGEAFTEYELWINALAPFEQTMVFGFTNAVVRATDDAYIGYIPTDRALALGVKAALRAETECMEAGSFPGFFHGVRVGGVYSSYAVGIESQIKKAIASLWAVSADHEIP